MGWTARHVPIETTLASASFSRTYQTRPHPSENRETASTRLCFDQRHASATNILRYLRASRAVSSVGSEHLVYTEGVGGSSPSPPTQHSKKPLHAGAFCCSEPAPCHAGGVSHSFSDFLEQLVQGFLDHGLALARQMMVISEEAMVVILLTQSQPVNSSRGMLLDFTHPTGVTRK